VEKKKGLFYMEPPKNAEGKMGGKNPPRSVLKKFVKYAPLMSQLPHCCPPKEVKPPTVSTQITLLERCTP